jgi:hypothetical protein
MKEAATSMQASAILGQDQFGEPSFAVEAQRAAIALYRELAEGRPFDDAQLAEGPVNDHNPLCRLCVWRAPNFALPGACGCGKVREIAACDLSTRNPPDTQECCAQLGQDVCLIGTCIPRYLELRPHAVVGEGMSFSKGSAPLAPHAELGFSLVYVAHSVSEGVTVRRNPSGLRHRRGRPLLGGWSGSSFVMGT